MTAMRSSRIVPGFAALLLLAAAGPLFADSVPPPSYFEPQLSSSISPLVPVSAFARPAGWLDASRLRVSTTVSVGTGWNGAADALQITSLSYQLASPLSVRLSLGNAFGRGMSRGNGMFLEGFAVAYRPHPSFQINVNYRDIRTPLQYQNYYGFGGFGR